MRLVMKGIPLSKGRENAIHSIPPAKGTVAPHTLFFEESVAVSPLDIPCGGCGHTLPLHDIPIAVRPSCCPFCGEIGGD